MRSFFLAGLCAVVAQAADRDVQRRILSVETYMEVRRGDVGVRPVLAFLAFKPLNLRAEVLSHPVIVELTLHACDMTILDNVCYHKTES